MLLYNCTCLASPWAMGREDSCLHTFTHLEDIQEYHRNFTDEKERGRGWQGKHLICPVHTESCGSTEAGITEGCCSKYLPELPLMLQMQTHTAWNIKHVFLKATTMTMQGVWVYYVMFCLGQFISLTKVPPQVSQQACTWTKCYLFNHKTTSSFFFA